MKFPLQLEKVPIALNSSKSKIDKLDVYKLIPVPGDLSKISDAVKNDIVKKIHLRYIYMLTSKILKIKYLILLT